MRARAILPPIVNASIAIPRATLDNMVASLETRVLNLVPTVNPLIHPVHTEEVMAVVCPTSNMDHPLSPLRMAQALKAMNYQVIVSPTPIPRPAKFESQVNLREPVAALAAANGIKITEDAGVISAKVKAGCSGTVVIFPLEQTSFTGQSHLMPLAHESSLVRIKATGNYAFTATEVPCGTPRSLWASPSKDGLDMVLHGLNTPVSASMRWRDSRVTKTILDVSKNTCEVSWPAKSKHGQTSPLQALAHEFLRLEEMQWINSVIKPLPFEKWVQRYPEQRRLQLAQGRAEAEQVGLLLKKHARVSNFIKIETTNNFTDPRNISPREDVFMSVVGPFIAAVEHQAHRAPFLVKGLNLKKRDAKMAKLRMYQAFIEIDFARFDMTVNRALLEVERTLICSKFPRDLFPELHRAYDLMMETHGKSTMGTLYHRLGGRNSGDLTTSIGNGLLNRFGIWLCLRKLEDPEGFKASLSAHEGDDGLIGVFRNQLDQAVANLQFLWVLGLQPKIDVYHDISQTSFCGRFLADTEDGIVSYADPLRTLTKIHTTCASGPGKELMCAKALSYLHTDGTTPIIGAYSYAVSEVLRKEVTPQKMRRRLAHLLRSNDLPWAFAESLRRTPREIESVLSSRPRPEINNELRAAFAIRTGYSIKEQLDIEAQCYAWAEQGHLDERIVPRELEWVWKPNVKYILDV